jgi:regulator of ribonuclease activity A
MSSSRRGLASVADLCDAHVGDGRCLQLNTTLTPNVQVLPFAPPLYFHDFGGVSSFAGKIQTVSCKDSNPSVRAVLSTPGEGRVLVVDGGGSTSAALLGDMIGELAVGNGWAGVLINGVVRDSAALKKMSLGIKALGTHPCKSHKDHPGTIGEVVSFGRVIFRPGEWLAADVDGVIVSPEPLTV